MKRSTTPVKYPFIYLNHGPLSLASMGKCSGAYLGFVNAVPDELRMRIRNTCPKPIRGSASFLDNLMSIETPGDIFDWEVLECYGSNKEKRASEQDGRADFGQETADRFTTDVERWAIGVHAIAPLVFIMGPCVGSDDDPWNHWSEQVFTEHFVPFIDHFIERNPSILIEDENEDYDMPDIDTLDHTHVACMLQAFGPPPNVPVPAKHQERIDELLASFSF